VREQDDHDRDEGQGHEQVAEGHLVEGRSRPGTPQDGFCGRVQRRQ